MTTENRTSTAPTLEQLEARRRALAYQVEMLHDSPERDQADAELDQVEDAIDRVQRDEERRALARAEAQQRDTDAGRAAQARQRAELRGALAAGIGAQVVQAGEIEETVATLVDQLRQFLQHGAGLGHLGRTLGLTERQATLLEGGRLAERFVIWQLGAVLPKAVPGTHPSLRASEADSE
jgi:hypothetical protein